MLFDKVEFKKLSKGKAYIFDMDGVLADFSAEHDASTRFWNEEGFFLNLNPVKSSIKAMRKLISEVGHENVFVLTKGPNNEFAEAEKKAFIVKHVPEFNMNNFQYVVIGQNKESFIDNYNRPRKDCLLIEDSRKNSEAWYDAGGSSLLFNGATILPEECEKGNWYELDRTFTNHSYIRVVNNLNELFNYEFRTE